MSTVAVTQRRVAASELLKLRTLRSTWITMGVALLLLLGFSLLICGVTNAQWDHLNAQDRLTFDPVQRSLVGTHLSQLAIGVLGVLTASGEYGTGMIRATFSAVPRRLPVVWAKVGVFAGVTLVITLVAAFISFFGGQALLGSHGSDLSAPHAFRSIVGVAIYLGLVGAIGVALGFILRSTAGAITTLVLLLLPILPGLLSLIPGSVGDRLPNYFPGQAGSQIFDHSGDDSNALGPWAGLGVMVLWAAVSVAVAAVLVQRRDA